ncbi:MBL fold metallo-hydrolase [Deinococcus cellulosilyticus NBRC 106333 = KACC 11606]|uniref:MBL fold metallo-hydrolase n=2 Tax=Deinococcus cellulosilyticus TaxID=401558 RepID=A0A511N2S1_DEIC1|nr:MBL fold metallo-hydrolase [Deinococcus cellulosilyticus NBRC 106333 = KACC 11606]
MYFEVAPHVWGLKILFVNVYFVQNPTDHSWVLIDAGMPASAPKIKEVASTLFGPGVKPSAIVMTHGHFDHRGALGDLLKEWEVPVYAHPLEVPYLNGTSSYPPPDPTVGGGMMAWMSFTYPKRPIDISEHLQALPEDGSVPGLPEWRWIHTPGHSPGHVSFFRESDRSLIVGDAFVTTRQESAFSALTYREEISGPPKYFTPDWKQARTSVEALSELHPEVVAAGHGKPMKGPEMQQALSTLAQHFQERAVPKEGRYVRHSAMADESGTTYVPPQQPVPVLKMVGVAALTLAAGISLVRMRRRKAL